MDASVIRELIENADIYEAHICRNDAGEIIKKESLPAHTELTVQYFNRIWHEKNASAMLDRFWTLTGCHISQEAGDFWREMIEGIPVFHDIGKINPDFQRSKMKNIQVREKRVFSCIAGRHSILSAVLYLDYFLEKLAEQVRDKTERRLLRRFILYHAYVIERHHSDLNDFERFLESLEEGAGYDLIEILQDNGCACLIKKFALDTKRIKALVRDYHGNLAKETGQKNSIEIYAYVKLMYSLLVASDYYGTSAFRSDYKITEFGNLKDGDRWRHIYENTRLMQTIRKYQAEQYPCPEKELETTTDINRLRTELLCDAEEMLKRHGKESLFYLEAPTGSGKSNTALNLSLKLLEMDQSLKKLYYIYPFNTLVEQNLTSLEDIFGDCSDVFEHIGVVNCLVPIKMTRRAKNQESETENASYYQRALLDRQFLNDPVILSTHVSLFDTMFGDTKESAFGFHQLMNSVIVLDEIQSYKNTIWGEIICFLKIFSKLLNIRIIIMSATLPNLDLLSEHMLSAALLLKDSGKYFSNPCFRNRVNISYELLDRKIEAETLLNHVKASAAKGKKVLVEFIKKDTAYSFFRMLSDDGQPDLAVEYMSGDDSIMERSRILRRIKALKGAIVLVATQVIEAGVDLDMDVGYKDISKLDSEEQFLGRINRSCLRSGTVYFFHMDNARMIYKEDVRVQKEFTLENAEMRRYLETKKFGEYYQMILQVIKKNYNDHSGTVGLKDFFSLQVGELRWNAVKKRMRLIEEDQWSMSVYLARILEDEDGTEIDGTQLWNKYVNLLGNIKMEYAEKRIKLSEIVSKMNYFIYQIKRNDNLIYNDHVGDLFYIEDGEKFFDNGKINRKKLQGEIGEFVDFI